MTKSCHFRLDADTVERLAWLQGNLTSGLTLSQSDVIRALIAREYERKQAEKNRQKKQERD